MIEFKTWEPLSKCPETIFQGWQQLIADSKYGFLKFITNNSAWEQLAQQCLSCSKQVVVIGMGGSSQGVRSLGYGLNPKWFDEHLIIIDHIDDDYLARQIAKIKDPTNFDCFVISKSGNTAETLWILNRFIEQTQIPTQSISSYWTVITQNNEGKLAQWADQHKCKILPFPADIEGRFSILSPPGLAPLVPLGLNLEQVRKGALWALQQQSLTCEMAYFFSETLRQEKWITAFWFYSERLQQTSRWLAQLWAESLSKSQNLEQRVSTPLTCIGTNDQHSLLQQMEDGYPDKSHLFITVESRQTLSGNHQLLLHANATSCSLEKEAPVARLHLSEISEQTLGALHMLFELVVGTLGKTIGVEIYGQPGVERSKKILRQLLES